MMTYSLQKSAFHYKNSMKAALSIILLSFILSTAGGQNLQDTLSFYADVLIHAEESSHRLYAHQMFDADIRKRMESDAQFKSTFDLGGIPILYNPDSSFRMVSWQVQLNEKSITKAYFQYRGQDSVIAFKDKISQSAVNEYGTLPVSRWIGAVYTSLYKIPALDSVYLLKGFNHLGPYSTLQVMEILDLRGEEIQLGAPLFENAEKELVHRRLYEVANGSNFNLVISDSLNRIVSDHLVAVPYNRNESIMVNVPDGSYEVLEWNGEHWEYKERLFENRFQDLPLDSVPKKRETRDLFGRPKGQ